MPEQSKDKTKDPVVIKKYANRRLYNTQKSCYVTLEDLAQMVRNGDDFIVRDAKTSEDITRSVLAQIIFDEEAKGQNMLPIGFLRQLIGLYGDNLQGFVPSYLEASMEAFARNQEQMREHLTSALASNPALGGMEAMARTNMEWFENAMNMFSPFGPRHSDKGRETSTQEAEKVEKSELDALKDQLEAMQDQLSKISKST